MHTIGELREALQVHGGSLRVGRIRSYGADGAFVHYLLEVSLRDGSIVTGNGRGQRQALLETLHNLADRGVVLQPQTDGFSALAGAS